MRTASAFVCLCAATVFASCKSITMPDQSQFDLSNQVQQWKFTIDQAHVAVIEFRLGSSGNGVIESVAGREWNFDPDGTGRCTEPLHLTGTASSGVNYSLISFTVNNRNSGCAWNIQGGGTGSANLPKLTNAVAANGTMNLSYQGPTPKQPVSGNWTAVRCPNDKCN